MVPSFSVNLLKPFRLHRPNAIPLDLANYSIELIIRQSTTNSKQNADLMNSNLHRLADTEGILQATVNRLITQSKFIINDKKTEGHAILSLNIQLYFYDLVENDVHKLNHLLESVTDQRCIIPFLAFLTEHKFCEDLICYISPKVYFTKGELHVITHKIRKTLHKLTYLTCSIQESNKISFYGGITFFISESDVLSATNYDLPHITKSQLKSKLAHTLLRNIETSDLLHQNVLTLHKTENEKSLIAFQCIKDTFLLIDTEKNPCNQIDIKRILNPQLVTLFDNVTIIDQHILYKQNSLNLNFIGMLQNKQYSLLI